MTPHRFTQFEMASKKASCSPGNKLNRKPTKILPRIQDKTIKHEFLKVNALVITLSS